MRTLLAIVLLSLSTTARTSDDFENKIYTPEVVVDTENSGDKGAVQLLWQKDPEATRYEIEVSNGNLVYSQVGERHFHHVMIFFDKNYQWRVREVSSRKITQFSPWRPLKVVRGQGLAQNQPAGEPDFVDSQNNLDEVVLDIGDH